MNPIIRLCTVVVLFVATPALAQSPETTAPQPETQKQPQPQKSAAPAGETHSETPVDLTGNGFEFWPGTQYDPAVPTLEAVVGHANGARITRPSDVIRYFEALATFAPEQVKLVEYARSWEGRPLVYAVIGSKRNIARLDAVKDAVQAVADPRSTDAGAAAQLMERLPATVWLAYGVHGNEISGSDAAIMTAYHLLAAQGDPVVEKILENTLVFIDPMQNPDGRARFVHNFETTIGLEPDGSPIAAERNEPWPGGRTNHYLFDMNRDWFVLTQPETVGRVDALREWLPLVFVDLHEMGTDSTYYFAPEAVPYNPNLAKGQRDNLMLFGQNNAKWFDQYGFDYFTHEVYDAFYPGYGASWPSYYGAVAMTYEQSSARGLKARRRDGTQYDYRDTVRQQFVASVSTAEAGADNREKLWQDFYDYRVSAIEEGENEEIKSYIFPAKTDGAAARKIAGLLTRQGVEIKEATDGFTACDVTYEAGSLVVNLAQPAKRFIRTLLDRDVPVEPGFLEEQERLREKDLPDQIYDVTAWSLPLMFGADMDSCTAPITDGPFIRYEGGLVRSASLTNPGATLAFLVPWGEAPAARLAAHVFRNGLAMKSADKPFTQNGRTYPAGTLIIPVDENAEGLGETLADLARNTGAEVIGVNSGWVTDGPNFGSRNVVRLHAPKIAIAWDDPTSSYSAGNTRFVIERQFDYPVTPVRVEDLRGRDLDRFDVLILPSGGNYGDVLGSRGTTRLREWVRAGGTLVGTGRAVRWLSDPDTGLLSASRELAFRDETNGDAGGESTVPGTLITDADQLANALLPARETPDPSAGVLVKAITDADHWLAAGTKPEITVLARGGDIYAPVPRDEAYTVARFAGPDELLQSGYLWADTGAQLAYKPFVLAQDHGDGQVIAFTQDPTVRAYLDGLNVIFMNAIFRGPAHVRPAR